MGWIGLHRPKAGLIFGRHIGRRCCRKRLTMTEPTTQRFRLRIQTLMVAIALLASAISVLRVTPLSISIGGWEAAIVWRESFPLIKVFHTDELADSYPRTCNSVGSRSDAVYEVRLSAIVALTALTVGFFALTIRAGAKLRRMRRALTDSGGIEPRYKSSP
jgi:hypothetical protein